MEEIISFVFEKIKTVFNQIKWVNIFAEKIGKSTVKKIFSKANILSIAKNVYNKQGYDLKNVLKEEISVVFSKYGADSKEFDKEINELIEDIVVDIKKEKPEFYSQYLLQDTNNIVHETYDILNGRDKNFVYYSIIDVENKIKEASNPNINLSLDYYELDDPYFEEQLKDKLNKQENILIKYYEIDEAFLRIINYLKTNNYQNVVIIGSQDDWAKLADSNPTNQILIPVFKYDYLKLIPNNINVIITDGTNFHENENSYLALRKRTRNNLHTSLVKIGLNDDQAGKYIADTNGLFLPLQKKLCCEQYIFNDKYLISEDDFNSIYMLFLINTWSSSDNNFIECELNINDVESLVVKYSQGNNPLFVQTNSYSHIWYSIAHLSAANYQFFKNISSKQLITFIDFAFNVLSKSFDRSSLCDGISKSLIYIYYYSSSKIQSLIQNKFQDLFDDVCSLPDLRNHLAHLSTYCDIVPGQVIDMLEKLYLKEPRAFSDRISFYDYQLVFVLEKLIQINAYSKRAILLVSHVFKYNSCVKQTLERVFCIWYNFLPSTLKNKKPLLAKEILLNNQDFWEIIYHSLPQTGGTIVVNWPEPFMPEEQIDYQVPMSDYRQFAFDYFDICLNNMNDDIDRIIAVADKIYIFGEDKIKSFIKKIKTTISSMDDKKKAELHFKIVRFINKNRYFKDSSWALTEERLAPFIKLLTGFNYSSPEYNYYYLYKHSYDSILLDPSPFKEDGGREDNDERLDKLRRQKLTEFKNNNLDLGVLISLFDSGGASCLGTYVADVYDNYVFSSETFSQICTFAKDLRIISNYVYAISKHSFDDYIIMVNYVVALKMPINTVVCVVESFYGYDDRLIPILSSLHRKYKIEYWKSRRVYANDFTMNGIIFFLSECKKYGNKDTYLDYLHTFKEVFNDEDLCKALLDVKKCSGTWKKSDYDYDLSSILQRINPSNVTPRLCKLVCDLEIDLQESLRWENMRFTKYCFAMFPEYYVKLCANYYKADDDKVSEYIDERFSFSLHYNCAFCPGVIDGVFNKNVFKKWISTFAKKMNECGLSNFVSDSLGRLLAHSPAEDDGIIPKIEIRNYIESNGDSDLLSSFVSEECKKRGAYTVTNGAGEKVLGDKYKSLGDILKGNGFKECAKIYYLLSRHYYAQSISEREYAE